MKLTFGAQEQSPIAAHFPREAPDRSSTADAPCWATLLRRALGVLSLS